MIGYRDHNGRQISGAFIMLLRSDGQDATSARIYQDGFAVVLTPADWHEVRTALFERRTVSLSAGDEISYLQIQWRCDPTPTDGLRIDLVTMYHDEPTVAARLASVPVLTTYLRQIESICGEGFAGDTQPRPIDVVIVIQPGGRARVWFVGVDDEASGTVRERIEALPPPVVTGGAIAFALSGGIGAFSRPLPDPKTFQPPMPQAWKDVAAAAGKPVTLDTILDTVFAP